MADHDDTLRRLGALGVGAGWTCLLAGAGAGELEDAVRQRVGPRSRVAVLSAGGPLPDRQFDFVLAREGAPALPELVARLWFGGLLLLESPGAEGPALKERLVAAGLEPVGDGPGAAHGRRPQFITSY